MRRWAAYLAVTFSFACAPNDVTWTGAGKVRFGMSLSEAMAASNTPLHPDSLGDCDYVSFDNSDLLFMVEEHRVVRVDIRHRGVNAPGGGHVGMAVSELQRRYSAARHEPHKYIDGSYYIIPSPSDTTHLLLFETDRDSVVQWRMGLSPQVSYLKGCS